MKSNQQSQFVITYLNAQPSHQFINASQFQTFILDRPKLADFKALFEQHFYTYAGLKHQIQTQLKQQLNAFDYNHLAKTASDMAQIDDLIENQTLYKLPDLTDTYWNLDQVVHHHPKLAAVTNGDLINWLNERR